MLETQVGLTMLLSDRAIPYLLKTSINMLLLHYACISFVYCPKFRRDLRIVLSRQSYRYNVQNLIKVIYTWQGKMTGKVRNVRRENGAGTCASTSVHEENDKFIIRVTRTDIIVVLTRITKIF